jgi:signal transduction histidine kinase
MELLLRIPVPELPRACGAEIEGLAAVQDRMMRHYFRLLRAQQSLDRRLGRPTGPAAAAVAYMETERARLAHELHSSAGQALAGIAIHLELIDTHLQNPPEQVRISLRRIHSLAQEALGQVRSIARRVHPPDWERLGLREALERLWENCGIPGRFEAALSLAPLPAEPPHEVRVLLYRVAQEALTNAIRHAGARRLALTLTGGRDFLRLTVEDDGQGFDPTATRAGGPASGGIGLRSMREQTRRAGGELRIESGTWGTRVAACVPVPEPS